MKLFFSILLILFSCYGMAQVLPDPTEPGKNDGSDLTTGMRFSPKQKSIVTGLRYFRDGNFTGSTVGHLWDNTGKKLAEATFPAGSGWINVSFISPILIDSAKEYIASFSNDGGFYAPIEFFFPKDYPLFKAITSHFTWYRNSFPTITYNQTNYSVEPILQKYIAPPVIMPDPPTTLVRDTIYLIRDTCSIDYTKINDLTFVLVLPDEGGQVRLPDSTTGYQAIYGAIPPHIRFKDDIPRIMYRFQRTYTISGVSTAIRFTMFKTGAWIRERKDSAGIWQIYPYAPY